MRVLGASYLRRFVPATLMPATFMTAALMMVASMMVAMTTAMAGADTRGWAGTTTGVVGRVESVTGASLEGVEVLLLAATEARRLVARSRSDASGRFQLDAGAPGPYLVQALLEGYTTAVRPIDTRTKSPIQLILSPRPVTGATDAASAWALRAPRRSLWHDVRSGIPGDGDSTATFLPRPSTSQVRVDQWFSVDASAREAERSSRLNATETQLLGGATLTDDIALGVSARRSQTDADGGPSSATPAVVMVRRSAGIVGDFSVGAGDRLRLTGEFGERNWSALQGPGLGSSSHEVRGLRSQLEWLRDWGVGGHLEMKLASRSTQLVVGAAGDPAGSDERTTERREATGVRSLHLNGRYVRTMGIGHALRLDWSAARRSWDLNAPLNEPLNGPLNARLTPGADVDSAGWELHVAQHWAPSPRWDLAAGLGHVELDGRDDTRFWVPRCSASWSSSPLSVDAEFAYHAAVEAPSPPTSHGAWKPGRGLGYLIELDLGLTQGLRLVAGSRHEPLGSELGAEGTPLAAIEEARQPFVADARVEQGLHHVALLAEGADVRAWLRFATGRAVGWLVPYTPLSGIDLAQRDVRFDDARVGVNIEGSGTAIEFAWRRISEARIDEGAEPGNERAFEVNVEQSVPAPLRRGDWRLLADLHLGESRGPRLEHRPDGERGVLDPLGRRVRAGLSVAF